jgi:predicted phosphodiesterase
MKIITIGDIHGRDAWKDIVRSETFDKLIIIGDYFDSFEIWPHEQQENFRDIITYKKANMNKVVLLFGNHEYHYLRGTDVRYNGYQEYSYIDYMEMLDQALAENLISMCFQHENLLFTHAGVTKTWCRNYDIDLRGNIPNQINDLFKYQPQSFRFQPQNYFDKTGDSISQSPIWVRPESLQADAIDGFIQIVGHTRFANLIIHANKFAFIDTLGTSGEYLVIEDGEMKSKYRKYLTI